MEQKGQSTDFKVTVTILTVVFLSFVAVPHFRQPPRESLKNWCIANIKQMDSAKEQWAMDNHKPVGSRVKFSDLAGPTLYMKAKPKCPNGGFYSLNRVGTIPTCTTEGHVLPP